MHGRGLLSGLVPAKTSLGTELRTMGSWGSVFCSAEAVDSELLFSSFFLEMRWVNE